MRRTVIPELLDHDAGTPREIADSLADLRRVNRWFGGTRTTAALVRRVADKTCSRDISLLEVGAGSGDVPKEVQRRLASSDLRLTVTLLDRRASHLSNGTPAVVGDALALPFRDSSFDLVSCGLFLHHLEPPEALLFAREALRVARKAVVINDLDRSWFHLALIYAGMPLYRSRLTQHDSVASAKRAYTEPEIRELFASIAPKLEVTHHYLCRLGVILWK